MIKMQQVDILVSKNDEKIQINQSKISNKLI